MSPVSGWPCMRWSIVRLIWFRDLRDQLRDRRTVFMIAVLPVLLYPIAGFGLMQLAIGFFSNKSRVTVVGGGPLLAAASPRMAASWFAVAPAGPGMPLAGLPAAAAAAALARAPGIEYPLLFEHDDRGTHFLSDYFDNAAEASAIRVTFDDTRLLDTAEAVNGDRRGQVLGRWRIDRSSLDGRETDLLVVIDPDFMAALRAGDRPAIYLVSRPGDDRSRLLNNRVTSALHRWSQQLKEVRLVRAGLPADYDNPFDLRDPEKARPVNTRAAEELFNVLVKIFPFVLVMWALAGALYPAVDLCAGEKERGTMETLLISPASREEIVYGKFLTIWVFSAATALLNLVSMGLTTREFSARFDAGSFHPSVLIWGLVLLLPLSAFFSAVCLAVGAYARSSKEGQYYLMPLFLVTMPLIFLTLAPGVELSPFYSLVPVTGVALLLQKLMAAGTPDRQLALYFIPVLAPMVIYGWLALRWAIDQFQREEVLFREAERLDIRLWLRRLFREKEALPSTGQALFCFALVLGLHRLTLSVGHRFMPSVQLAVSYLAFVAAPALFMALLVTTRPHAGLALRLPPWWACPAALVLALLLFVPGVELTYLTVQSLGIKDQLREYQDALSIDESRAAAPVALVLEIVAAVSLLQAVCEELTFRGFILTGLRRRFRPRTAVFLSSFLFALFHMNVFQFVPHFVIGIVLSTLVLRTGSVLPAMVFHFAYNCLVYTCLAVGPEMLPRFFAALGYEEVAQAPYALIRVAVASACLLAAVAVLAALVMPRLRRTGAESGPHRGPAPPVGFARTDLAHRSPS
jgi:sodium transport system permease protein